MKREESEKVDQRERGRGRKCERKKERKKECGRERERGSRRESGFFVCRLESKMNSTPLLSEKFVTFQNILASREKRGNTDGKERERELVCVCARKCKSLFSRCVSVE